MQGFAAMAVLYMNKLQNQRYMKRVKAILTALWLAVTVAVLQSCNDDDTYYYYLHSNTIPTAMVTVKPDSCNTSFHLQLDDSTTLLPTNMRTSPFGTKEVRALINYTATNVSPERHERQVTINWIDSILTKPTAINMEERNDSAYGNDPVEIVDSWETVAEDGYLTLRFRTNWLPGSVHRVNLVHRTDADKPYLLQFYHDAGGPAEVGNVGDGIVAFRLDDTFNEPDSTIEITLQWKAYGVTKTQTFNYMPRKD